MDLRTTIESTIEEFLKIADTKVHWKDADEQLQDDNIDAVNNPSLLPYTELVGEYSWKGIRTLPTCNEEKECHEQAEETDDGQQQEGQQEEVMINAQEMENDVRKGIEEPVSAYASPPEGPYTTFTLLLHGTNRFSYKWTQTKDGKRPMEHMLEIIGDWKTPLLNRDMYGNSVSKISLLCEKIAFNRKSRLDKSTEKYKLQLSTFERNGQAWVYFGKEKNQLPPTTLDFVVNSNTLCRVQGDNTQVGDIITLSPACRILAGLTKRAMAKLGVPITILTPHWLIGSDAPLVRNEKTDANIEEFNPLKCFAQLLRNQKLKTELDSSKELQSTLLSEPCVEDQVDDQVNEAGDRIPTQSPIDVE